MRCTTSLRGLSDLKTASTVHVHCKPHSADETHLDLFLLNKEKERLEKKHMMLEHQQRCIRERVNAIVRNMAKLERRNEQDFITDTPDSGENPNRNDKKPVDGNWKKMSLGY